MRPSTRVTFFHDTLFPAGEVVRTPDGWKKATISLERHPDFQSLIKFFKGNFQWYGRAMQLIKQVEANDGPNGLLRVLIEVAYSTGVWRTLFEGQLKLAQLEEIIIGTKRNYKMLVPMIRDDFWSKFINRYEASVNLQSTTDLDGGTRSAVNKITLPMPSQKIRSRLDGSIAQTLEVYVVDFPDLRFLQFDNTEEIVSEIQTKFNLPVASNPNTPVNLFSILYDGTYEFDFQFELSDLDGPLTGHPSVTVEPIDPAFGFEIFYQLNQDTPIQLSKSDTANGGTAASPGFTRFTYNTGVINLKSGDEIRIYGRTDLDIFSVIVWGTDGEEFTSTEGAIQYPAGAQGSWIKGTSNTVYKQTETDAYLLKEAAESIISKLVGQDNAVKSNYLSNDSYNQNAIFRGKHVRGYPFSEKEFAMSMKEWWNGANGLLNLSLGYTEIGGVKKIEIEDKAFHFNPTPVVNIGNVKNIVRRYDLEKFYRVVELAFKKSLSESESGIDDPQTNRFLNTDFSSFGKDEKIVIEFLAASLAIERSRRNQVELGKDDRNDEEIIVVAVKPDGEDGWTPEFGDSFAAITNLLNADFRINVRHSTMRIFKRWQNWLSGCMTFSTTGIFRFGKGEGNYEMTSQLDPADYEAEADPDIVLAENGNVSYDPSKRLLVPKIYEIKEVPLSFDTFEQIDANKNRAVGFSRTESNYKPMFLMDFNFEIFAGNCNGIIMQATDEEL